MIFVRNYASPSLADFPFAGFSLSQVSLHHGKDDDRKKRAPFQQNPKASSPSCVLGHMTILNHKCPVLCHCPIPAGSVLLRSTQTWHRGEWGWVVGAAQTKQTCSSQRPSSIPSSMQFFMNFLGAGWGDLPLHTPTAQSGVVTNHLLIFVDHIIRCALPHLRSTSSLPC